MNMIEKLVSPNLRKPSYKELKAIEADKDKTLKINIDREILKTGTKVEPYSVMVWNNLKADHKLSDIISDEIMYKLQYLTKQNMSKLHKVKKVEEILNPIGIFNIGVGTNRMALQSVYYPQYVLKYALDMVGIKDSPREFRNQEWLKPFCTKIYEVSPCGTLALVESVKPFKSRADFNLFFRMISEGILWNFIAGRFAMDDIGFESFMNYGVREEFGPVILDFPYLYAYDYNKIICSNIMPDGSKCGGYIDYEMGYMDFVCPKCGQRFSATEIGRPLYDLQHIMQENKAKKFKVIKPSNDTLEPIKEDFNVTILKDGKPINTEKTVSDYSKMRTVSFQRYK